MARTGLSDVIYAGQELVHKDSGTGIFEQKDETFAFEEMTKVEKIMRDNLMDPNYKRMQELPYGPTVKLQFYKEQLEHKLDIHKAPTLCTPLMFIFVIITKFFLVGCCFTVFDILRLNDQPLDTKDAWTLEEAFALKDDKGDYKRENDVVVHKCIVHARIFSVAFSVLFPQILLSPVVVANFNENTRTAIDILAKLATVISLLWGFVEVFKADFSSSPSMDGGVHGTIGVIAFVFIFIYVVSLGLKLFGWLVPALYEIRLFGKYLKLLNNSKMVEDRLLHFGTFIGVTSIMSGFISYVLSLRTVTFDAYTDDMTTFRKFHDETTDSMESAVAVIIVTLIVGHSLVEICHYRNHYRKYHTTV